MSIFYRESLKMTLHVWGSKLEIWSCSPDLIPSSGSQVCKVIEFPVVAGELWVNFNYLRNPAHRAPCISWIMVLSGFHRQTHASLLIPEGSGHCWLLEFNNIWGHFGAGDGEDPEPLSFQWASVAWAMKSIEEFRALDRELVQAWGDGKEIYKLLPLHQSCLCIVSNLRLQGRVASMALVRYTPYLLPLLGGKQQQEHKGEKVEQELLIRFHCFGGSPVATSLLFTSCVTWADD